MKNNHWYPDLAKSWKSFPHAIRGIKHTLATENNFKFHALATLVVIAAGFFFNLMAWEWIIILILIGQVLVAELLNTALENYLDWIHPDHSVHVKKIKDVCAAAVLIASILAAAAGLIIFIPKIF